MAIFDVGVVGIGQAKDQPEKHRRHIKER